ncbi:Phage-related protein [Azotobacter beijerinckii]|uniref:Phage-related protein n=1 Tax=Azotobacter beijerinckii TaxID=170623 RepID=A0A1I0Z2R5_9GAMM|nr:Phage-related protein [Azotobacter beijerinckii]
MPIQTFNWPAQHGDSPDISYRTRTAQFGDGYAQVVGDGINNKVQSHAITWTGAKETALEIMAFLDEHAGYKAFLWRSPLGELGLYRCRKPVPTPLGGGIFRISATFEQAFHPASGGQSSPSDAVVINPTAIILE